MNTKQLGRVGYEAYAASTGGKTFDGRDMPAWDALPQKIQNAWSAAGVALWSALGFAELEAELEAERRG